MTARLDKELRRVAGMDKRGEVVAGLNLNSERVSGALEYRHRLRRNWGAFASLTGGHDFGSGRTDYGATVGMRWEW